MATRLLGEFSGMDRPAPSVHPTDNPADWHWRHGIATMRSGRFSLRELKLGDAQALLAFINTEEVVRYLSMPPSTVEGFERFIAWTHRQRAAGVQATCALEIDGFDTPVGLFQLRSVGATFSTAEWGFALGSAFWGTGAFRTGAELMLRFAFEVVGVHRLEARACVRNERGSAALRKMGAVREGVLRQSFRREAGCLDEALWTLIADEWRRGAAPMRAGVAVN
jgi:RimJ/RimL family protein N-acetyltransferase